MSKRVAKAKARVRPDRTKLLDYALKSLSMRAYSAGEVRERLRRKGGVKDDIDTVMSQLKEYGCLDDEQFARMVATARKESHGLGRARALRDLRARRVSPSVAEQAVAETYAGSDESDLVEAYLARKFRRVSLVEHLKEPKNLAAAFRRLRYAGFSAAISIRVLRRYSQQAGELDESSDSEA